MSQPTLTDEELQTILQELERAELSQIALNGIKIISAIKIVIQELLFLRRNYHAINQALIDFYASRKTTEIPGPDSSSG